MVGVSATVFVLETVNEDAMEDAGVAVVCAETAQDNARNAITAKNKIRRIFPP
jgi:hypothetical protein